jgi:DNA replication protein DnaC
MKTINELIAERTAGSALRRRIAAEDNMIAVYKAHPRLAAIDNDLLEIRKSRMIAAVDHDDKPVPALEVREKELFSERETYIKDNNIDPDFEEERVACEACGDTGYSRTKDGRRIVCPSCMSGLLEEAFDEAGLSDYSSYTIKAFAFDRFGDAKERKAKFNAVKALFEEEGRKGIAVYSDRSQSGKTYLTAVAVKYAIIEAKSAYYAKAEHFEDMSPEKLEALKSCAFVAIDDYSAESTFSRRVASSLNSLLEARCANGLPTLIVSTFPFEDLVAGSDARISGKIVGAERI